MRELYNSFSEKKKKQNRKMGKKENKKKQEKKTLLEKKYRESLHHVYDPVNTRNAFSITSA